MQCYSCFDYLNYQFHGSNYDVKSETQKYLKAYKELGEPIIECEICGIPKKYEQKENGQWQEIFVPNL